MPLKREQKQKIIQDIKEKIDRQKAIVFVGIKGLKTKEIFNLRESLKKADCLLAVVKKTLITIAFKEKKLRLNSKKLEGEVALIFGFGDEISPARISHQFSLSNANLEILGGFFENKFIENNEVITLAKLSSKEEILAKVVSCINAPIVNFLNVLQGNIRNLVYILNAIKQVASNK